MSIDGPREPVVAVVDQVRLRRSRVVARWLLAGAVTVSALLVVSLFAADHHGTTVRDWVGVGILVGLIDIVLLAPALLHLLQIRKVAASTWMFGVEPEGLRLAERRFLGGHVLIPWVEVAAVWTTYGGRRVAFRLTADGTRRTEDGRKRDQFPMRWSTITTGDAVAAVREHAPGLTQHGR